MADIHYNRTTNLERREKIISLEVWFKTGTNHRRSWIIASNGIQCSKQIPSKAYLPGKPGWKERTVSTADIVEFVEYSKLTKPSSYASEIRQALVGNGICAAANAPSRSNWRHSKERPNFHFQNTLFALKSCSVAHLQRNSQTCLQNIEVTLETLRKISSNSCHKVQNELSNLLAQVATCSTQTVNQNTNVLVEVCKVPIKKTSGLTVNIRHSNLTKNLVSN